MIWVVKRIGIISLLTIFSCTAVKNKLVESLAQDYSKPVQSSIGSEGSSTKLVEVASGFSQITDIQFPPKNANQMFVLEQPGKITRFDLSTNQKELLLDISDRVLSKVEQGLLGLAFHPQFQKNDLIYLNYTTTSDKGRVVTRISERKLKEIDKEKIILEVEQPYVNHNAGQLAFGPDGYLYIGFGDGGWAGDPHDNGQNKNTFLGSMVRIGVGESRDTRPEIWAYGLRNPWKYSFAPDGRLIVADVGQDKWEEVSIVTKGGNYGWNTMEGYECYDPDVGCNQAGLSLPILTYGRDQGQSITGGYVYRDKYYYADFVSGNIWRVELPKTNSLPKPGIKNLEHLGQFPIRISTFGRSDDNLYLAAYTIGKVYQIVVP